MSHVKFYVKTRYVKSQIWPASSTRKKQVLGQFPNKNRQALKQDSKSQQVKIGGVKSRQARQGHAKHKTGKTWFNKKTFHLSHFQSIHLETLGNTPKDKLHINKREFHVPTGRSKLANPSIYLHSKGNQAKQVWVKDGKISCKLLSQDHSTDKS